MTGAPGCNQCGDGPAAPAACTRSATAAAACRARIRGQIEDCYVAWIAALPSNTARTAWFDRMVDLSRDPARIADLRRKVFARMVAEGRATVPVREEPAELDLGIDW